MLPVMDNAINKGWCVGYDKKEKSRLFEVRDKVLKRILPIQEEVKGKFAPTWQGQFIVQECYPEECPFSQN